MLIPLTALGRALPSAQHAPIRTVRTVGLIAYSCRRMLQMPSMQWVVQNTGPE